MNPHLARLQDYPFTRLANLLADLTPPADRPALVMSIGEPQESPPSFVPEILAREAAGWGRYPPTKSTPALLDAIVGWLGRRFDLPRGLIDAQRHVLPAAGTREALFQAALAAVPAEKAGGRPVVLLPNPFYQVYVGAAVMAGAEPVFVPATAETGFLPDFLSLPEAVWARAAMLYLCNPGNPQGAVAPRAWLDRVLAQARRFDVVVAADECYAEIYRSTPPCSILEVAAAQGGHDPLRNVLAFHSLSKRSSAPGLRSGFVAGDGGLIEALGRLRAYGGASMPLPIMAASAALWNDDAHVREVRAGYNARFDLAAGILGNRFGFTRPEGGFFLWLDVGDGEAATRRLWGEAGIKVLPGAYLARGEGDDNPGRRFIRVALVHDLRTAEDGLRRIAATLDG